MQAVADSQKSPRMVNAINRQPENPRLTKSIGFSLVLIIPEQNYLLYGNLLDIHPVWNKKPKFSAYLSYIPEKEKM